MATVNNTSCPRDGEEPLSPGEGKSEETKENKLEVANKEDQDLAQKSQTPTVSTALERCARDTNNTSDHVNNSAPIQDQEENTTGDTHAHVQAEAVKEMNPANVNDILETKEEPLEAPMTPERKEVILAGLKALVKAYENGAVPDAHAACELIYKVEGATEDEKLSFIRQVIGENEDPKEYGYGPRAKTDDNEQPELSSQEEADTHLANQITDLSTRIKRMIDQMTDSPPAWIIQNIKHEVLVDARKALNNMARAENPRIGLMNLCLSGSNSEFNLRNIQLGTRDAGLIREHIACCRSANMKEVFILMMELPALSKLHAEIITAAANVVNRLEHQLDSSRHNLDKEVMQMTKFEKNMYIPAFVSVLLDLLTERIVELSVAAASDIPIGEMKTEDRLRFRRGMTEDEKLDLFWDIRREQHKAYILMVSELMNSEALGKPGDMSSLPNQNIILQLQMQKGKDKMAFISVERACTQYSFFDGRSLDRGDFHVIHAAALYGMFQNLYLPDISRCLMAERKFKGLLNRISTTMEDGITQTETVLSNMGHIGKYALEAWLGLGELDSTNYASPGVLEALRRKLINPPDYEEIISKVVKLAQGYTDVKSSITGYPIDLNDWRYNARLLAPIKEKEEHGGGPRYPAQGNSRQGGRGGRGQGGQQYAKQERQNCPGNSTHHQGPSDHGRRDNQPNPGRERTLYNNKGKIARSVSSNSSYTEPEDHYQCDNDSAHQSEGSGRVCYPYGNGSHRAKGAGAQYTESSGKMRSRRTTDMNDPESEDDHLWRRVPESRTNGSGVNKNATKNWGAEKEQRGRSKGKFALLDNEMM